MSTTWPAERRIYRGAIIGFGSVARQAHLPAFVADPEVRSRLEIVAAVDAEPARAELAGLTALTDLEQLRELGPIDFVDICTPTSSHFELVLWALHQGYHVLCEKPVAVTRAEAKEIAHAARRAERIVIPCHQYRFNPAWCHMHEWLSGGAIGHWHLAELSVHRSAADPGATCSDVPWRGVRAKSSGGILLDHGTHLIYTLLDLAGPPASVRAWTGRLRHREYDVEDSAQLLLEYPDRLASVFLTWAATRRETRARFVGELGSIDWSGGVLRLERDGHIESHDLTAELDKSAYPKWFARLFRSFAAAMDERDGVRPLDDIAQVAAVLESAYESSRTAARFSIALSA
jgi:predicted dehydrogenase